MVTLIRDAYSVLWTDLCFLKRFWKRTILTSLISPMLYLLAFGYGLGRSVTVDNSSYLTFVIPGIIALTAMSSSFNGAGAKLNVDRLFYKSFDELLMSPVSLSSIVIGKGMVGVIRGTISATAFIIIGKILAPELDFNLLFFLSLLLSLVLFSFLGVSAAFIAKSHQDMGTFTSLVILPMTFLGGTFFSLNEIPHFLKVFLSFLPLTHSSLTMRAAAMGQEFPWVSLIILAAFGLVFFSLSFYLVRKLSV